ncbi:MAG: hypothetical protein ABSB18_01295 [Candidatus Omnitrophota bacterium]
MAKKIKVIKNDYCGNTYCKKQSNSFYQGQKEKNRDKVNQAALIAIAPK